MTVEILHIGLIKVRSLKLFILLILLFFVTISFSQKQGQTKLDSLLNELPKAKQDTNKVKILYGISGSYSTINLDKGIKYGEQALILATKLKWRKGIAKSLSNIGINYTYKGDYQKAMEYHTKSLGINKELGARIEMAKNYNNIGVVYKSEGEYPSALENYFMALKIREDLGFKNDIATNLNNIAGIYEELGENDKALEYDNLALKNYDEMHDKFGIASVLDNMANSYNALGKNETAIEYEFKAIKLYEYIDDKRGLALSYFNLCPKYEALKNYPKEIEYIMKSYKMFQQLGDKRMTAMSLGNIGRFYSDIAADSIANIKVDGGLIPLGKEARMKKSEYYFQLALASEKQISNISDASIVYIYQGLFETSEALGNYKDALKYFKKYTQVNDSIYSNDNKEKISKLETQRELALKDKQIKIDQLEVEKKRNERVFFIAGIALLLLIIGIVFRSYKTQQHTNKLLSKEKQRSDDLLLNILPAEVAEELKNKGSAEARLYDNVTVMFTDFVNFTKAGETMEPGQLIGELDTCFKAFDEILNKHHVEKIKTIGDAYLAVSGLPAANPNHAKDMVAASIEIRDYMLNRRSELGDNTFEIRIGVHSGNVVAGIVGLKKFAYDIWGDTVNIAARMEQSSEPCQINVSQTTYEMVKDNFEFSYRGDIDAKNKGKLSMYFVEGNKS